MLPLPADAALASETVPESMVIPPVKLLTPDSATSPAPVISRLAVPA